MPSSNSCTFTALRIAVIVTTASVAVTWRPAGNAGSGVSSRGDTLRIELHGAREQRLDLAVAQSAQATT